MLSLAILGTRGIPAGYGGFETFAEQLSVRLVQKGYNVTVYAETDQVGLPDTWHQGVRIRHVVRPRLGAASVIGYDCLCLLDAHRQHDVVYMLGYGAAWACWFSRLGGQCVWINVDGLEWARSKWGWLARTYLRLMEWVSSWAPSRVIADAQAIADHFRARYPNAVPSSVIAYGAPVIDVNQYESDGLKRWGLLPGGYALVVARPEPENHVLEIIQAYLISGWKDPLVVVGDVQPVTPYQKKLLSLAGDRVHFVGGIYDSSLLSCMRVHAACYLHGHSVGGTNPSLLEALACGNLILAHDNPFNREVARNAALYFRNEKDLVARLNDVLTMSASEKSKWTVFGRQVVQNHYRWEHIAETYESLMKSELSGATRN